MCDAAVRALLSFPTRRSSDLAFPEASVNFQVSREEALARARTFITGLGENIGGYKSSIIFDVDEDAKVYLERQLGLSEANRSEEHTSELQSRVELVCRLLLEK